MDVVITYVDINDNFINEYNTYCTKELQENRFRSYGVLDLQVKQIRKYMPYVKNIFIVVSNEDQISQYSLPDCKIIKHSYIIPNKYLPCYNSCTIEMFLWKIPGLAEEFVYFNDDTFVIDYIHHTKWFIKGKPCLNVKENEILGTESNIYKKNCINSTALASSIAGKQYDGKYLTQAHCARPFLKSTCEKVFDKRSLDIYKSLTRLRHSRNYNATLFNDYDYFNNNYYSVENNYIYCNGSESLEELREQILIKDKPLICINDNDYYIDFDEFKRELRKSFEDNLNDKKYKKVVKKEEKKEINSKYENHFISINHINNDIIKLLNNSKFKEISVDKYLNDKELFKEKIIEHRNIFESDYKIFIENLKKIEPIYSFGNKIYNKEKAVISLTTWKNRIITVSKTLYNLLVQCPNFHIVLVLSEEEFSNKENDLPDELLLFLKHNLIEILWVGKNYKAFKKILFTMNKYRNVPIISADDDCVYLYNYAEAFYTTWLNNKNSFISCWTRNIDGAIHTAGASTLYPPYIFKNLGLKCLSNEILNYTNQDDDYYTELRRELNLTSVKIIKRWNLTYYFHDEIDPLHDEIKLTTKKDLHNFLKGIINKYNKDIVVSMTSYPKRISNIYSSIRLILEKQTLQPDKIYLWLSEEEFPNKENDLPKNLLNLINDNKCINLMWIKKNTYVHKRHEVFKYINDGYVFFLDDDVEYNPKLIESIVNISKEYPNTIILYNRYSPHIYEGIKIRYKRNNDCILGGPYINKFRWCGQSMIPANIYPKEILSDEYQKIRNNTSPVSDECWFQPWVVYNDIPLYSCDFGWGKDISEENGKRTGLVSWSHQKDENGYERRDIWLNNVLKAFPEIYKKYKQLFNYDEI